MTARAAAARYARALFDVVRTRGDLAKADAELTALADLMSDHAELARVAASPAVPVARKRAIVEALVGRLGPSTEVRNLALLLTERDRLLLLARRRGRVSLAGARAPGHRPGRADDGGAD